jgi:hypothetical protein
MTPLISNLIVIALVAGAALIMGRRAWRSLRGSKTGCGCASCPAVKNRGPRATLPASPPAGATASTPQRGA